MIMLAEAWKRQEFRRGFNVVTGAENRRGADAEAPDVKVFSFPVD